MNKITILDILLDILFIIAIILFLFGLCEVINFAMWNICYNNSFDMKGCERYVGY